MNRTMLATAIVLLSGSAMASSLEGNPDLYGTPLIQMNNADDTMPSAVQRGVGDRFEGERTERAATSWPDNQQYGTNDAYGSPLRDVIHGLDW